MHCGNFNIDLDVCFKLASQYRKIFVIWVISWKHFGLYVVLKSDPYTYHWANGFQKQQNEYSLMKGD